MSKNKIMGQDTAKQGPAEWLNGFFELLELDVTATQVETDEAIEVDIRGADADYLLAAKGKPLGALQTVAQQISYPREQRKKELSLDVEDYRQRKEAVLKNMAGVVGKKAIALKKPIAIIGLDAFERRAVHSVFAEDGRLQTESAGFGSFRRLKISQK